MQCRYQLRSIKTKVRAILTPSGFLESVDAAHSDPLGIILERTPFYAGKLFLYAHCACSQIASNVLAHQCGLSTPAKTPCLQRCILFKDMQQVLLAEQSLGSAESGGQVADTGELTSSSAIFTVTDTKVRLYLGPLAAEQPETGRYCNAVCHSNTGLGLVNER